MMNDQPPQLDLASFEADLFGVLFAFQKKIMTLLRESSLDDDKVKVVGDQIKKQLDDAIAEMKEMKQPFNVAERLNAIYEQAKRLVEELRSEGVKKAEAKPRRTKGRKKKP